MIYYYNKYNIEMYLLLFLSFIFLIIYRFYELYSLTYFNENCFKYKKFIVNKINLFHINDDFMLKNEYYLKKLFLNNPKCVFHKININSHYLEKELKSELILKCYCYKKFNQFEANLMILFLY